MMMRPHHQHIVERDDDRFETGMVNPAGPFESRRHAEVVALAIAEHHARRKLVGRRQETAAAERP